LLDADSHNFPNLALMKISAFYRRSGAGNAEFYIPLEHYDVIYASKVFTFSKTPDLPRDCEIIRGGSGYDMSVKLDDNIEHITPDYSLYGINDRAYGYLTRGCPRRCPFCIVAGKEGAKSVPASPLKEFWRGQKEIVLLDPNLLACESAERLLLQLAETRSYVDFTQGLDARLIDNERAALIGKIKTKYIHTAWDSRKYEESIIRGITNLSNTVGKRKIIVYCLVNYDTPFEYDLYRLYKLRGMGVAPFVMIYDKSNAPLIYKRLARWCNRRWFFKTVKDFYRFAPEKRCKIKFSKQQELDYVN